MIRLVLCLCLLSLDARSEFVDAVVDLPFSNVALAVSNLSAQPTWATTAAFDITANLTGAECNGSKPHRGDHAGRNGFCNKYNAATEALLNRSVEQSMDGSNLNTRIYEVYEQLRKDYPLGNAFRGRDISESLSPFKITGMSFIEAEALLRDAGFTVRPRPDKEMELNPNRAPDWFGVLAVLPLNLSRLFSKTTVYVTLLPRHFGDYSAVQSYTAVILVSSL